MSNDYGEPLELVDGEKLHDELCGKVIVNCHGEYFTTYEDYADFGKVHQDLITRTLACTNALAGIPTEQLPEVKKAWLAWTLLDGDEDWYHEYANSKEFDEEHTFKEFVEWAIRLRKAEKDFGELNALIDSL